MPPHKQQYCNKFLTTYDYYSPAGQAWVDGTLTCLKNGLLPLALNPSKYTCDQLKIIAFDTHVRCYIDNGFCQLIYNFMDPSAEAGFLSALLKTYEVADFLSLIAIKQVWSVMTQCPLTPEKVACPYSSQETSPTVRGNKYVQKTTGATAVLGWKPALATKCESCGTVTLKDPPSSSSSSSAETYSKYYGYDYMWNAAAATRPFWTDKARGFGLSVRWYETCPDGYKRSAYFSSTATCGIPSEARFQGEDCSTTSQCSAFAGPYASLVCAPTANSLVAQAKKCMYEEEAANSPFASTCECSASLSCSADSCRSAGSGGPSPTCALSSADGKKHCAYGPVGIYVGNSLEAENDNTSGADGETTSASSGPCDNCRAASNACRAYGGLDKFKVNTASAALGGGMMMMGVSGVVGVGLFARKRMLAKRPLPGQQQEDSRSELMTEMGVRAIDSQSRV